MWKPLIKDIYFLKPKLHSFNLLAPTQRRLQPPGFTNTNYKEAPTPSLYQHQILSFTNTNWKEAPTP
jgi:hypothetical protein